MNLEQHMVDFAQSQIKTMGPDGKRYVRRCLEHWKTVYGKDFARRVAAELNKGK